jgi:flagella basal body P-ring formation protein FlgA
MTLDMWRLTAFVFSGWFTGLFVLGGLLSLAVGMLANRVIEEWLVERYDEAVNPTTFRVMVAAVDIASGHTIVPEDLYAVEVPSSYLPENVFLSPEYLVGRTTDEALLSHEFIRAERLAP